MPSRSAVLRCAALLAAAATGAHAHMSVNPPTVEDEGSYFRVAMRVPHGCGVGEGDDRVYYPTHTVEVNVPAEIAQESTARGEWVPFWPLTVEDQVRLLLLSAFARAVGLRCACGV